MNKKILFQQSDSSIALMSLSPLITIEDAVKAIPEGSIFEIFEESELPNQEHLHLFFDALEVDFQSKVISFNITKAKELTKIRLRKERTALFEKNDIVLRDAIIEQDQEKLDRAIAERDRLRNITDLVNNVDNLDELINLHP